MTTATDVPQAVTPLATVPNVPRVRQLLPWGLSSSLLLYLCFFPVAWGWLGWVALVPLLRLIRTKARGRTVFMGSWLTGLAFFFPAVQWLRVADPRMYFTWFLMAFYCSWYFPMAVLLVRSLDRRRIPLVLSLPVVWTALEFLRAHLLEGFPWYYLAHTQHNFLPLIQIADVTGAYGVTFLVAAVNAVIFEWLYHRSDASRRPVLAFQSAIVLFCFAGFLFYGSQRMSQAEFAKGPTVALIQGNVEQRVRNESGAADSDARDRAREQIQVNYDTLSRLAAAHRPDLVVYPETSYPDDYVVIYTDRPQDLTDYARKLQRETQNILDRISQLHANGEHRPLVLLGINSTELYPEQNPERLHFNSALLVGPSGEQGKAVGRYDKIHRVPFGEYVPLRDILPFMDKFSPYDYDYGIVAGRSQVVLPVGQTNFGVLICYEDTDTVLARRCVAEQKPGFLVNISNDGWFNGTAEHEEHLAVSRFRAVETRRSLVRSVNMGISAVIDGNGRVLAPELKEDRDSAKIWEVNADAGDLPLRRWSEFKKVSGVLFASVPLDDRGSLYSAWGDWLPWGCWALLALALVALRPLTGAGR